MIPVTPIAGRTILLDADLIEAIETDPNTVVVLADRRRMVVQDVAETLVAHIGKVRANRLAAAHTPRTQSDATVIPFPGEGSSR